MKTSSNLSFLITTLVAMSILSAGCSNILNPPHQEETAGNSAGVIGVTLRVAEDQSRTILPNTPVFSYYQFSFIPEGGQAGHDPIATQDASQTQISVELAAGAWTALCQGYYTSAA
jgi:hypothetical protein